MPDNRRVVARPVIPRVAGVLIPLFSIRSRRDAANGDIPALRAMVDLTEAMGHRAIQLLPLDETAHGQASPYSALSVFAIDPIYVGIDDLPGVAPDSAQRARATLGRLTLIDREKVRAVRLALLEESFRKSAGMVEKEAQEAFAERNRGWLDDYALFRALKDRFNFAAWEEWPQDLRRREPGALAEAQTALAEPIAKYVYWQFLAYRRWVEVRAYARGRGVMLGGDLAFSPARDSAEVWAHQELFDLDRTVGAPPDGFNPDGQRWGLPAPRWDRMRANGFALLKRRVRHACALFDFVRVDHVLGLYRTFSFGEAPDDPGEFSPPAEPEQRAQGEEVIRTIQENAGGTIVIAEDLGMVPPFVRVSLAALGVPGYKVLRWERAGEGTSDERLRRPAEYPEISLATTGTHDTETLATWWNEAGRERGMLLRMLGLPASSDASFTAVHDAILGALYAAPSRLVILPIQDLFGWLGRVNFPGTVEPSNWSWRMPVAAEDMATGQLLGARVAQLRAMVRRAGR